MPARWAARSHPKTKHDQGVSQEKREQRQISLQTGGVAFTSCTDPASFSQLHAEEVCPGERRVEVLERGVEHLLLLLGTSPVSGIVQANAVLTPHRCSQVKTTIQVKTNILVLKISSCEDQLSHKGLG